MGYEIIECTIDNRGASFLSRTLKPTCGELTQASQTRKSSDIIMPRKERAISQRVEDRLGLVLELAILFYNIIRMIEQKSLGRKTLRQKWALKRHWDTVINKLNNIACYVIKYARKLTIGLNKSNAQHEVFKRVYYVLNISPSSSIEYQITPFDFNIKLVLRIQVEQNKQNLSTDSFGWYYILVIYKLLHYYSYNLKSEQWVLNITKNRYFMRPSRIYIQCSLQKQTLKS